MVESAQLAQFGVYSEDTEAKNDGSRAPSPVAKGWIAAALADEASWGRKVGRTGEEERERAQRAGGAERAGGFRRSRSAGSRAAVAGAASGSSEWRGGRREGRRVVRRRAAHEGRRSTAGGRTAARALLFPGAVAASGGCWHGSWELSGFP
ncbi:hypothetical protein C8J57DRAFT_1240969 [Mycena rebaudengoi]|nr:hypothetical protein C8J57DRAFT_1240969 [Mycena rebaudengoi]